MTYIILAAGKGSRLHPLTLMQPKCLYKLDKDTTVLKRMVSLIKKFDSDAKVVIVVGYMHKAVEKAIEDVTFIHNPFYEITNSIASLWFARDYMAVDNLTLINGDIVMEEKLIQDILCKKVSKPMVLLDSSIRIHGDYNIQVNNDKILVMSKELDDYDGEYAGVTKLDEKSIIKLKKTMEIMIEDGMYDQWYENALDQMIFNEDFELFFEDVCNYKWTEVDCVSDMLLAKKIHLG